MLYLLLLLLIYTCTFGNPIFAIKMNWGIRLPNADKIIYHSRTEPGRDWTEYLVIRYNSNGKIKRLNNINWKTEKNVALENEIFETLSILEIDENYCLDFNNEYWYYQIADHDDQLFLVYFPKTKILYVIEDFC